MVLCENILLIVKETNFRAGDDSGRILKGLGGKNKPCGNKGDETAAFLPPEVHA